MNTTIDEIKQQIRIKDVVQHYLKLTQKGRNYWAICPFHSDTKPSLSVSEEKNVFKCFSCGCCGDAICFVMKKENLSFAEGIIKIGKILNIDVGSFDRKPKNRNLNLFQINEIACNSYSHFLKDSSFAKDLLIQERKLTQDLISFFKIGFSGNEPHHNLQEVYLRWNITHPREKISFFEIEKLGILRSNQEKQYINFFRNRIMFPVMNENNQITGFSGRTIDPKQNIKYLNSQESNIFKKNESLYNIQNLKKDQPVYVYEGFFDLISAYKIGFTNGVAVMGSTLHENNLKKLSTYHSKIILCFDNDLAGIKNTISSAQKCFLLKIEVHVVFLTQHKDIDSLIIADENQAKKALESTLSFFEWYPKFLKQGNQKIQEEKIIENINFFLSWSFNVKTKKFLKNVSPESAKLLIQFAFGLFNLLDELSKNSNTQKHLETQKQQYINSISMPQQLPPYSPPKYIAHRSRFEPPKKTTISLYKKLIIGWIKHESTIRQIFQDDAWFFGWQILDYASLDKQKEGEILKKIINFDVSEGERQKETKKYDELMNEKVSIYDFFMFYFTFIDHTLDSCVKNSKNLSLEQKLKNESIIANARTENKKKSKEILDKLQLFSKIT